MDRIDAMRLFIRIVDLGSFTAAAEELDMPRSNVTYAVQNLEKRLGARLLNRSTRHLNPTPEGLTYYERCRRVLEEVEHAESLLGDSALHARGRLRVDLQPGLATELVFPHLGDFCRRHPGIELVIGTGDRLVDLAREDVDCVLRGGTPLESGLAVRSLAELPVVTCASRRYIATYGMPATIDHLREHQAVNFLSTATGRTAPFEFLVNGKVRTMLMRGQVSVTTAEAYRACCLQGLGFIQSPRYGIAPLLESGELVEVFGDTPPPPMPISILFPPQRRTVPRVRVFIDWLVERVASWRAVVPAVQ